MTLILEQHEGKTQPAETEEIEDISKQTPPPGQKPCRYGVRVIRQGQWYIELFDSRYGLHED